MRAQKNFQTVECYTGLKQVRVPKDSVVLLECMSNLTAKKSTQPEGVGEDRCSEEILAGVTALENQCRHLVIVSNEVFEGGTNYDPSTVRYLVSSGKQREIAKRRSGSGNYSRVWIWHKQGGKTNDFDSDRGIFDVFGNSDAADRMDK